MGTQCGGAGSGPAPDPAETAPAKVAVRDRIEAGRSTRSLAELGAAASALAERVLAHDAVRRAAVVACYVSVGTEPGTTRILETLHARGTRVLLPLTVRGEAGGLDLDWAAYAGPGSLVPARFGLLEPATPPLGLDAVAAADLVLAPAMAVDRRGTRLGKGAGCYDKALARRHPGTPVWAVVYDDEVLDLLPAEPHDRPVDAAVTPGGFTAMRRPGG